MLTIDNPLFKKNVLISGKQFIVDESSIRHPIYPPYLNLEETTDSNDYVDYIGMRLRNRRLRKPSPIIIDIAPTKQKFPVPKINYPSLHGNFPAVLGYGVFTGQLHRFANICTTYEDFIHNSTELTKYLIPKGYSKKKLIRRLSSFIYLHNPYRTHKSTIIGAFLKMVR